MLANMSLFRAFRVVLTREWIAMLTLGLTTNRAAQASQKKLGWQLAQLLY